MDTASTPVGWFGLSAILFCIAIQQPLNLCRILFSVLHILATVFCLASDSKVLAKLPSAFTPFVFGVTVHTTSLLFIKKIVIGQSKQSLSERFKASIYAWSNVRRIPTCNHEQCMLRTRCLFALRKLIHGLGLLLANRVIDWIISKAIAHAEISVFDFSPSHRHVLFPFTYRVLVLRAIYSVYWIWMTYYGLSLCHDASSIIAVSIFRFNKPSDWPDLFRHVTEAYSLRRFWGIFWHKLHLAPFLAYTPSCLKEVSTKTTSPIKSSARALWLFGLSAVCHIVVHWVQYRKDTSRYDVPFFVYNWLFCNLETVSARYWNKHTLHSGFAQYAWIWRLLGYLKVILFFMCTVPAWQYHFAYDLAPVFSNN